MKKLLSCKVMIVIEFSKEEHLESFENLTDSKKKSKRHILDTTLKPFELDPVFFYITRGFLFIG